MRRRLHQVPAGFGLQGPSSCLHPDAHRTPEPCLENLGVWGRATVIRLEAPKEPQHQLSRTPVRTALAITHYPRPSITLNAAPSDIVITLIYGLGVDRFWRFAALYLSSSSNQPMFYFDRDWHWLLAASASLGFVPTTILSLSACNSPFRWRALWPWLVATALACHLAFLFWLARHDAAANLGIDIAHVQISEAEYEWRREACVPLFAPSFTPSWLPLLTPIILTSAFVVFVSWRKAKQAEA